MLTATITRTAGAERFFALARNLAAGRVLGAEPMARLGKLAARLIVARTRTGKDASGAFFAPYSETYAKRRARLGLPGTVDLFATGALLGSLAARGGENAATLFFADGQTTKALYHQEGRGHLPRRAFFGLAQAERTELERSFADLVRREYGF